eukprot:7537244-Alexandrium_andersonii.AAC.1
MRKAPICSRLLTGKMRQKHLDDCRGRRCKAQRPTLRWPPCAPREPQGGSLAVPPMLKLLYPPRRSGG